MMPAAPRVVRDRRYSSTAWRRARDATLARDGYTCQGCGRVGRQGDRWLVADHKVPPHRYPAAFADTANLWCLCKACNNSKGDATVEEWRARTTRPVYGPRLASDPTAITTPIPPDPMRYPYHAHRWGPRPWQVIYTGNTASRWPTDGTCPPDCSAYRRT